MYSLQAISTGLFLLLCINIAIRWIGNRNRRSPPGPPGFPFIGHVFSMPKDMAWEKYHEWCKEYNTEIIEVEVLGTSIVILDTAKAAKDLLDKRSSIYSSRPRMPMVTELMGWDFNIGTMPYGPRWRAHRRSFEKSLNANCSSFYEPQGLKASRILLLNLLNNPERFMDHFRYMAGSVILSVAYGIDTQGENDPYIKISEDGIQPVLEAVVPGTYLVDTFPILKYVPDWMPFFQFKSIARRARSLAHEMKMLPFEATKKSMELGHDDDPAEEEIIKNTAATMYSSGTDNIIATLAGFVMGILSNPEAQLKAQNEIDCVLGNRTIPTFNDRDALPYTTALTMEVLRWSISSPLGGPHLLETDDEYNGYTLRRGTIVFANIWAILHDETAYPDPMTFNPERFIENGNLDSIHNTFSVFGFGRRICPGRHMAFSTIWIAVASILATFHVSKALDDDGKPIEALSKFSNSSSCVPFPFQCSFRPRGFVFEEAILSAASSYR